MKTTVDLQAALYESRELRRLLLERINRDFLRELARRLGVRRGRNKSETIENLISFGFVPYVSAKLTVERRDWLDEQ